jgi:hypothetical protein
LQSGQTKSGVLFVVGSSMTAYQTVLQVLLRSSIGALMPTSGRYQCLSYSISHAHQVPHTIGIGRVRRFFSVARII